MVERGDAEDRGPEHLVNDKDVDWEKIDSALVQNEGQGDIELPPVDENPQEEPGPANPGESKEAEPEGDDATPSESDARVDYSQEVEVPLTVDGERESLTLGELKDRYVDLSHRESGIRKREAELANELGRLSRITAELEHNSGPLSPEQREQVGGLQAERVQREAQLMLEAIPEWRDTARFQEDRAEIVQMMAPYGVTEDVINSVTDHRIALLYKHMLDMTRRIERAEKVKPEPVKGAKRPRGKSPRKAEKKTDLDNLVSAAIASDSEAIKDAAIAKLLGA